MHSLSPLVLVLALASQANGHMSIWTIAMYGMHTVSDPFMPLGPLWCVRFKLFSPIGPLTALLFSGDSVRSTSPLPSRDKRKLIPSSPDDWWFRYLPFSIQRREQDVDPLPQPDSGAPTRGSPPADGIMENLPAGGSIILEIACNIAFSTLGVSPSTVAVPPLSFVGSAPLLNPSRNLVSWKSGCIPHQ